MISDEVEWQPRDNTVFRHEEIGRVWRKVGRCRFRVFVGFGRSTSQSPVEFPVSFRLKVRYRITF